jgi:hypothetical protein
MNDKPTDPESKKAFVAGDGLLGAARPKSRLSDGRMNPEWVALRKAERGGVASSTAWARAHPEAHRERTREALKKFRQTPKGEAAKKRLSEKRKIGRVRPDEVQCVGCGRVESRMETKLQNWVMARKMGNHRGICNECV